MKLTIRHYAFVAVLAAVGFPLANMAVAEQNNSDGQSRAISNSGSEHGSSDVSTTDHGRTGDEREAPRKAQSDANKSQEKTRHE